MFQLNKIVHIIARCLQLSYIFILCVVMYSSIIATIWNGICYAVYHHTQDKNVALITDVWQYCAFFYSIEATRLSRVLF